MTQNLPPLIQEQKAKTIEQRLLEDQIQNMPTDVLLDYQEYNKEIIRRIKAGNPIDKIIYAVEPIEKFGEDKELTKNAGIIPDNVGYASLAVVPAVVGFLTSAILKERGSKNPIAKAIGAAAATAGFELFSVVDTCISTANSQRDYEARKTIGFIDQELKRRQTCQTDNQQTSL